MDGIAQQSGGYAAREAPAEEGTRLMHWVGRVDWGFSGAPAAYASHTTGFARCSLVDRGRGAVHTDLGICRL